MVVTETVARQDADAQRQRAAIDATQAARIIQRLQGMRLTHSNYVMGAAALSPRTEDHVLSPAALSPERAVTRPSGAPSTSPRPVPRPENFDELVAAAQAAKPHRPGPGRMRNVYDRNERFAETAAISLSDTQQREASAFLEAWGVNRARYEAVAAQVGLPAPLIAAIHWRESSGRFDRYLHQGDRLGRPAVNIPRDIPVFHEWEPAAIHALTMFQGLRDDLAIDAETQDMAALTTFAEYYNGLGYYLRRSAGRPASPYAFAGTTAYQSGKYVADGRYDPLHVDQQLGVAAMLRLADGADADRAPPDATDS